MYHNLLGSDFLVRRRPKLEVLSVDQRHEVHLASLEILERTGVDVLLPEAVDLLREAGADVTGKSRVRIPSYLVEEALRHAPNRIIISDRNGKPAMYLEGHNIYYGTGTDTQFVVDAFGNRRPSGGDDVEKAALICDYLPNIDFVGSMGGVNKKEVDPRISDRHNFARMLCNTTKPIMFTAWSLEGLSDIYEMAAAVRGSAENFRRSPFIFHYAEPVTPLTHAPDSLQKLLFCVEKGIPIIYVCAGITGGTTPATLAGALALSNAEFLSGLVIAQLKRKGAPVVFGGGSTPMDMRTTVNLYSGPEFCLMHTALKEMASYYGLPDFNTAACSDSKILDQQAAIDYTFSVIQAGLIGSNIIHDVGYLESGLSACWEGIVMADEIIDQVRHFLKGIEVNKETLALDVIDKVGPGGNFLAEDHTVRHFKETWYPKLGNRDTYENWARAGSKPLAVVLNEKVEWILENHKPEPLSEEVKGIIGEILERANHELSRLGINKRDNNLPFNFFKE